MDMMLWLVALVIMGWVLGFVQARIIVWSVCLALWLVAGWLLAVVPLPVLIGLGCVLVPILVVLTVRPLRMALLSGAALRLFKTIMPRMSATESAAVEAGGIWWDAELFSGRPRWPMLMQTPQARLTDEEQAFLDNETQHLCDLANDWESTSVWQDLPPAAWAYAREKGFLGMIIPKAYGGLGFSALGHSEVIQKLSTRCAAASVSVMVPNSLGPAELLLHYGTEAQKDYYLPRLARGEDIPCFALTNPYAGSDAASITDTGVVCKQMWQGVETLGFRISWRKRYITLAPIATVVGLAFRALDPDGLLGGEDEPGITCVLIPRGHPGVKIGRRHWPVNAVFQNGPIEGDEVFVPMDMVIGGAAQVGNGWRMLMECLSAGRAISLPSSNVGMAKLATGMTGAYVAIRRQFNTPIGNFEGVQEALARMAGHTYATDAVRMVSMAALDQGEKPSVISAISKYHVTERARIVVNDAMDVLGGKGICMGPGNFMARAYQQIPVAITVEGANIMTRTLIIYGQGAIRCHPYVLTLMQSATDGDLKTFDRALFDFAGFVIRNMTRAATFSLTGGLFTAIPSDVEPRLKPYYRKAVRLSTLLALASDLSMASVGGALKRKGALTGRLGDILSQLYILTAVLKRFEDQGRPTEDLPFVHWAARDALHRADQAWSGVLDNHPNRLVAAFLKLVGAPFGLGIRAPDDACAAQVAALIQTHGPARDRLCHGAWRTSMEVDPIAATLEAFDLYPQVAEIEQRLRPAICTGAIPRMPQNLTLAPDWAKRAQAAGLISAAEVEAITRFADLAHQAIQVDDFPPDFDLAAGIEHRRAALDTSDPKAA
jgi:acyl-CoA dehydrogenase